MAKKRILSWLVAASLALSLLPAAALAAEAETPESPTLTDEILAPGKDEVIAPADDAAQELIDKTYDALNPSEEPADGKEAADIVTEETDAETGEANEAVKGEVLDKASGAAENAEKTKHDVENKLTVEVEGEGGETVETTVDEAVKAEADRAAAAKEAAEKAAADAAAAVEAEDEDALAQAKADAAQAVIDANDAYTNAQNTFDSVIDKLVDEAGKQAIANQVEEALKDIPVPGEDATEEEKAAYEAARVNAENAAKLEVANSRIDSKYSEVNDQIAAAKAALEAARDALTTAKGTYDTAVGNAQNAAGDDVDINVYVEYFENLNENPDKVKDVLGAYGEMDRTENLANTAIRESDEKEPGDSTASTPKDRITRDQKDAYDTATTVGSGAIGDFQLHSALAAVGGHSATLIESMKKLKTETDPEQIKALMSTIEDAQKAIFDKTYEYEDSSVGTLLQSPYDLITLRAKTNTYPLPADKGLRNALDRLSTNLTVVLAQYEHLKAEKVLEKALSDLSNGLEYKDALDLINTIAKDENLNKREELKDATDKLAAQKEAAEAAAQKAEEANKAYEAAQKAVQDALDKLKELEGKGLDAAAAKQQLEKAKGELDKAKDDKDKAEEEKKEADDAVIETEDEIEDIITGGGDGDTDDTDDDGDTDDDDGDTDDDATIEDGIVPLALMPTRGELMNYLYIRAGSPAAAPSTFTDVPAGHEFARAIGWAQANGIAVAYEDGTFDPDNFVIAADLTVFLTSYAKFSGMTVSFPLSTMAGLEDDAIVENADEILAQFFGD